MYSLVYSVEVEEELELGLFLRTCCYLCVEDLWMVDQVAQLREVEVPCSGSVRQYHRSVRHLHFVGLL